MCCGVQRHTCPVKRLELAEPYAIRGIDRDTGGCSHSTDVPGGARR